MRTLHRTKNSISVVFVTLIATFMLLPVLVVMAEALTSAEHVAFPPSGMSLKWIERALETEIFTDGIVLSLEVAAGVAIVGGIIGTLAAYAITWHDFRGKNLVETLIVAPLTLPAIGTGIALLSLESMLGLIGKSWVLFMAHLMLSIAFVVRLTGVGLAGIDRNGVVAAATLGARPRTVFWRIMFPQFRGPLVVGCLFAFIISFDEVGISLFLAAPASTTFPVALYSYMLENYDPLVMAAGTLLVLFSIVPILLVQRFVGIARALGLDE